MNTTEPDRAAGTAVIVGRWQIFHIGHETLLKAALREAPQVIVVIGSAFRSRNPQNPFTWQERRDMILCTLSERDTSRVHFLPVRDYFDDDRWNEAVKTGVRRLTDGSTCAATAITLVGFKKDPSSYYLDNFPSWGWRGVERDVEVDATLLRGIYFEDTNPDTRFAGIEPFVRPATLAYLRAWAQQPTYTERVAEHLAVAAYRKRWAAPFHLTADAVVQASGHVLLVRRGGDIGHGLWALPGGFVDAGERFYAAAIRELSEETGFQALASTMQTALQSSHVFDHPRRSPRGRIITQAFHFNLGNVTPPKVKGAGDAMEAMWLAIDALPDLEDQLFDDHAAILDRFVGLYR